MSRQQVKTLKPFCSILILMLFLFSFAFVQMENRRMGYSFLQLTVQEKEMRNQHRTKLVHLAEMTGPARVRLLSTQKLPMKRAASGQIIQMTASGLAIVQ